MADQREIQLILTIDGKEATTVLNVTSQQVEQLKSKIKEFEGSASASYKSITNHLMQYTSITEDSIDAVTKWLTTQNLSQTEIEETIQKLQQQGTTLSINSDEWKQNQTQVMNLKNAYGNFVSQNRAVVSSQGQVAQGGNQMNQTLSQLGWVLGDANMFMVDFRMGMMSIGNNIPMVVQGFMQARVAAAALGTTVKAQLVASLMGPGGLMLAINGVMLLLQLLPSLFSKPTDEIDKQRKAVDKLRDSLNEYTKSQLEALKAESERKIAELESLSKQQVTKSNASQGMVYVPNASYKANRGLNAEEQDQLNIEKEKIALLDTQIAKAGLRYDIDVKLAQLRAEQYATRDKDEYKRLGEEIKKLQEEKNKLDGSNNDKAVNEAFKRAEEELSIVQQHAERMAEIQKSGDAELFLLKEKHLKDMISLYKKYGQNVTKLEYELAELRAEIEQQYKTPEAPKDEYAPEDEALGNAKYLSEDELEKLRIDNIDNEFTRQKELADFTYQMELKKYQDYENFSEIKQELDEKHARTIERLEEEKSGAQVDAAKKSMSNIAGLFGKHTAAYKVLTKAQTLIDTYQAAVAAYKSTAEIPFIGPFLAPAAAAGAIAFGMARVQQIEQTKMPGFERGGIVVGEKGPEIIAPMREYAEGQAQLITSSVMAVERNMNNRTPLFDRSVGSEIKSLNEKLTRYLDNPVPAVAYISDREFDKGYRTLKSRDSKSRL